MNKAMKQYRIKFASYENAERMLDKYKFFKEELEDDFYIKKSISEQEFDINFEKVCFIINKLTTALDSVECNGYVYKTTYDNYVTIKYYASEREVLDSML